MRVGITGHQKLASIEKWDWVTKIMLQELRALAMPFTGISCLAMGADQCFAKCVLEVGGKLAVILPFDDYERIFTASESLRLYHHLLQCAETVDVLAKVSGDDEEAFLIAGRRVVEMSDLLFAVWDGLPAKGKGGSGDIVHYALCRNVQVLHINPIIGEVRKLQ
jgi:hypothetical protein